ncbi:MAG: hypothetical protein WC131_00855 [Bacilli bacterium]
MKSINEISRSNLNKKKNVWRKVFSFISWFFIVLGGSYLIFDAFLPDRTVHAFGLKAYVVQSESMVGIYDKGDAVFVSAPRFSTLKVGDIITYRTYIKTQTVDGTIVSVVIVPFINTHYLAEINVDENGLTSYKTMPYDNFHTDVSEWKESFFDRYYDKTGKEILLQKESILGKVQFSIPNVGYIGEFFENILGDRIFVILIIVDWIIYTSIFDILWNDYRESMFSDEPIVIKGENTVESDEI